MTNMRPSPQETGSRGEAIYEARIRPTLSDDDIGKFIAIDVESEDYELDEDDDAAVDRLKLRKPHAFVWLMRAGFRSAERFGYVQ